MKRSGIADGGVTVIPRFRCAASRLLASRFDETRFKLLYKYFHFFIAKVKRIAEPPDGDYANC
jgi:hypothetical protein